jgi:hypothetical protein
MVLNGGAQLGKIGTVVNAFPALPWISLSFFPQCLETLHCLFSLLGWEFKLDETGILAMLPGVVVVDMKWK